VRFRIGIPAREIGARDSEFGYVACADSAHCSFEATDAAADAA